MAVRKAGRGGRTRKSPWKCPSHKGLCAVPSRTSGPRPCILRSQASRFVPIRAGEGASNRGLRRMRLVKFVSPLAGPAALIALCGAAPSAQAATLNAQYGITLAGLALGTADVATSIEGERYQMQLQAKLTGLAGLMMSGGLSATAAGAVAGGRPVPSAYAMTSRNATDQRTVQVGLNRGNVAAISITPPL